MEFDFSDAAKTDDLSQTIDYFAVSQRIAAWGRDKSWKLIERIAAEAADLILAEFKPDSVTVHVKKFILPDAAHVSAVVRKPSLP